MGAQLSGIRGRGLVAVLPVDLERVLLPRPSRGERSWFPGALDSSFLALHPRSGSGRRVGHHSLYAPPLGWSRLPIGVDSHSFPSPGNPSPIQRPLPLGAVVLSGNVHSEEKNQEQRYRDCNEREIVKRYVHAGSLLPMIGM